MKKILAIFLIAASLLTIQAHVYAKSGACHSGCSHSHHHSGGHHNIHSSSGSSGSTYLVRSDSQSTEQNFPHCKDHYMVVKTMTNFYSDGTRRTYKNCTIYNNDGSVIESDCGSVNHILFNNKHYFIISKNRGGYYLINDSGENIFSRNYSYIESLTENRLLVKYNKKYGIVDMQENIIVPIKYQKLQKLGNNNMVFISKLNGYYGIIDINNNKQLIENNCDKFKIIHDTIMLKRHNKYGLVDMNGELLYDIKYDKIKEFKEYILLEKNNMRMLADFQGKPVTENAYKKIKMKRNILYGKNNENFWVKITN